MALLPVPQPNQAFWSVSALEAGRLQLHLDELITGAKHDQTTFPPSLSFLLRHSSDPNQTFLFDLGIRKDFATGYTPKTCASVAQETIEAEEDVVDSLRKGGLEPSAIKTVCLSHLHWDHIGDTKLFPDSTFVVGSEARKLITPGYPADDNSYYPSDLLPTTTNFIDDWSSSIGPFPRALDFYGDGSIYIINAEGHLPGHINVLARTSSDGAWIYLAGDSAHHWSLITGDREFAVHPIHGCMHDDKEKAAVHLGMIKTLLGMDRVRVMLAHDEPWYQVNKGGEQFWPGFIPSL